MLEGHPTGMGRTSGSRMVRRGIPAVAALVPAVALAMGTGPAAAAGLGAARAGHAALAVHAGPAGVISTVAGGVGGPARATQVRVGPCGVSYRGGHLLLAESQAVRSVTTATDWLTTPAGTNSNGPLGDGGPAANASLAQACGAAADRFGNIVVTDTGNDRLRVIAARTGTFYGQAMTAGDIYTVAGNGTAGFSGDGGPATRAGFTDPWVVTADHAGDLLISDAFDNRIRMVAG